VRWLPDGQPATLIEALRSVAPELATEPLVFDEPGPAGADPIWWSGTAIADGRFLVKFAWSQPAALQLWREVGVLTTFAPGDLVPFLPEVVVGSDDPVLLATRLVPGTSLFAVAAGIDRDRAGQQLAQFLAALHAPAARERAEAAVGPLPPPSLLASTQSLRDRLGRWIRPGQRRTVLRWCDWADAVLATPRPAVLVHGDLHGDNQVWQGGRLRLVVDFATVSAAEPEYDLRTFPGPGLGPDLRLLTATVRHYERLTGRRLDLDRIMAWHLRQALGDVLWRSEAGLPMADDRTPPEWVDDLAARFRELDVPAGSGPRMPMTGPAGDQAAHGPFDH
jgi:aminoglycoside phosphotransferase (APT) family kinase protein